MSRLWKRSTVVAAIAAACTLSVSIAQADPLSYRTRPGTQPPSLSSRSAAPSGSSTVRSFSYAPSTSGTTRSFSYAPSTSGTTRSYSYAPSTSRSYSYQPGYVTPRTWSNPCYCPPR